ncbi:TPA: hypothetical protein ACNIEN_001954 [Klebsiella pneumoniae]
MPVAQFKVEELADEIMQYFENKTILDPFTLRTILEKADRIPDDTTKKMIMGFAYGAAGNHDEAMAFFKDAIDSGKGDLPAINYLSYLGNAGYHVLHRQEAIKLARNSNSFHLYIIGRNAAYADGDGELSLFFSRNALSMISDHNRREAMEKDVQRKNDELNRFINVTGLGTEQIAEMTRAVVDVASKYKVLAPSHEYYTSSDNEAAVICNVICQDEDVIADMDIEIATQLAMNDSFSDKNLTVWFRGHNKSEAPEKL